MTALTNERFVATDSAETVVTTGWSDLFSANGRYAN